MNDEPAISTMVEILRIQLSEDEQGNLTATSPDLPGLLVTESDNETLWKEIPEVIRALYKADGVDVYVLPGRDYSERSKDPTGLRPWVAIPAAIAAQAAAA